MNLQRPFWWVVLNGSTLECSSNTFYKELVVEWLREKFHRACSHSLKPHLFIAVCCDEDGRNWTAFSVQPGL